MAGKQPIKQVRELVTYQFPITSYGKLEIDIAGVIAIAEEEGVPPGDLRIETSRSMGVTIQWDRPALERAS